MNISLFQSAFAAQSITDEAMLGPADGTPPNPMTSAGPEAEHSPQEQGLATLVALTGASQSRLSTERFYGVPRSLRETQGLVDTLVNSMSATVTQYAATAEHLSNNEAFDLLRS